MKKYIFLIAVFIPLKIFSFDGEFVFQFKNFGSYPWAFRFTTIPGETYYNKWFQPVPENTQLNFFFSSKNPNVFAGRIIADHIYEPSPEGLEDDFGNNFMIYYGKYTVSISIGDQEYDNSFTIDYKDCDYNGNSTYYGEGDIVFVCDYQYLPSIKESDGTGEVNYGYYHAFNPYTVWQSFRANDLPPINPKNPTTNCFYSDVLVRNLVLGSDYGGLYVDGNWHISGSSVNLQKGNHQFATYTEQILSDQLFRDWNQIYFDNPVIISTLNSNPVTARFFKSYPLTVTNYLEGGSGGTY